MNAAAATRIAIAVNDGHCVSGLVTMPPGAQACYVLAHGAGAGMDHPFMAAMADGLWQRSIATLRYQFPYMEHGSKRPDGPALAHATVRAAAAESARRAARGLLHVAGGKSFGGHMTSQAQAAHPLSGVRGLAFLGFPLRPAKKPFEDRGRHLFDVQVPMLFLQGTRDALAEPSLLVPLVERLRAEATLVQFAGADHSLRVAGRGARGDDTVRQEVLDALVAWMSRLSGQNGRTVGM